MVKLQVLCSLKLILGAYDTSFFLELSKWSFLFPLFDFIKTIRCSLFSPVVLVLAVYI